MVSYHDSTSVYFGSTTTNSIPKPTLSDGDILILVYTMRGSSSVTTPPSGFANIPSATGISGSTSSSQVRVASYWKHVSTAAGEPANYDLVASANTFGTGFAVSLTGADTADPIDVAALLTDSGGDANVSSPTVTTTVTDTLLVRGVFMNHPTDGFASNDFTPTDATRVESPAVASGATHVGGGIAHEAAASAGATGAEAWTVGGTTWGTAIGLTIAVQGEHLTATGGDNQIVTPGTVVTLDGSGTVGATTLEWSQLSGSNVMPYAVLGTGTITFLAPKAAVGTDLVFRLTASTGAVSGTDDVTVSVVPEAYGVPAFLLDATGQPDV